MPKMECFPNFTVFMIVYNLIQSTASCLPGSISLGSTSAEKCSEYPWVQKFCSLFKIFSKPEK